MKDFRRPSFSIMRVALTAAALALVPLAETSRLAQRRRQWQRPDFSILDKSDSTPRQSEQPLWKHRQLAAGVKPCDPSSSLSVDEPDVGILAQCSQGYSCRPLPKDSEFGAFGGGICVSDDDDGTIQVQRHRRLQIENYCTYYEDAFGYDCDCDNCK